MGLIQDSIVINASSEKIYEFLIDLPKNYKQWHSDHVKAEWKHGKSGSKGAELYTEEYLHEKLHKLTFRLTEVVLNKKIEYKILGSMKLIMPKGAFLINTQEGNCLFTATLSIRFEKLMRNLARKQMMDLKRHMREEGENLKKLLENHYGKQG